MAQAQEHQDRRDSLRSDNKPPIQYPANKDVLRARTNPSNIKTPSLNTSTSSISASPPAGPDISTTNPGIQLLIHRYQPSKVFITKCRAELDSLLDSIKDSYHSEFKQLYNDEELYTDLLIQIGEDFKRPLHKCIIASRAFKLYTALKAFEPVDAPVEKDIIVSEFQDKNLEIATEENVLSEGENVASEEGNEAVEPKSEKKQPEVSALYCILPDDLISPELLLNFVRRAYLNQDISEEELQLNKRLIDWIKVNKPELIKVPVKHSPNHRESFRTIQPDFEELTPKSPVMSLSQQMAASGLEDTASNVDDVDEASQATSIRDESLTGSLLTRTETFELISKHNSESSPIVELHRTVPTDSHSDDGKNDTDGDSNTQAPYAPTTRTGLKPKTFTTPTGLRTARGATGASPGSNKHATSRQSTRDETAKTKTASGSTPRTSLSKQLSSGSTSTNKRSSLSAANQSLETPTDIQQQGKQAIAGKTKSTNLTTATGSTGKSKPSLITRAHPISMERSQSPSTNILKGSGRNFIAANKRLISHLEKKQPLHGDQAVYDSETEISDVSSFALEPLTSDNIVAQMEKFALLSHSKLAEALSRMFIDEILADTVVLVKDGKQINAHRCILASRSAYLADLITKQSLPLTTPESVANNSKQQIRIDLTEFSYPAVYFSIMHIYSGIVKVPDDLDLEELAKLSHLIHVSTLRQVCMHNLRMNYCHFFHKPCNVCCLGVLKTLPLAWRYDYTELYSKCLQWIGSHFANIFCLKEFSELKPHDLLEECYSATLSQLTPDNIIPKTIECQKLLKNLPRVKWTDSVICLVGRQLEDFCHYVADNYEKILQSESFLNLGRNCWECEILEENLLAAMNHLKPDSGCKTLIQLHKIECSIESFEESRNVSDSFANLVSKMRKYCERYLLKEATTVVHCSSWRQMNPSLQKRIKDQAIIATDFDEPTKQLASKPKLPSMSRVTNQQSSQGNHASSDGARSPSNKSTPESRLKSPSTTYLPPPKNKTAAARHVKVLK